MRISIKTRFFLSHFLAVVLVSGSIGIFFYLSARHSLLENLKARLSNTAAMAAESVDIQSLDGVHSPADTSSPAYLNTLEMLRRLCSANPDVAYIYIMRKVGPKTVFVLDSDPTKRQALPGTEYPNPPASLLEGFNSSSVDDRLYRDAWGVFMSGYAPLRGGRAPSLLGIDMRDAEVSRQLRQLRLSGLASLVLSLGLAFVFATVLARRINRPVELFVKTCSDVAEGRKEIRVETQTGDELDRLASAINDMSRRLEENQARRAEAEVELKRSRDEMESKVRERTTELQALNERLLFEIEERKKAEQALFHAAMTDSLTGLLNRRAMEKQLSIHLARVQRGGSSFVVLLCDIDRFKSVNDSYGHEIGDQMLRLSAETLQTSVRDGDMVSRWGGEEFLILLADTDLRGGLVAAENLRRSFAKLVLKINEAEISRTISIGVTTCIDCRDEDEVVRRADEALYEAKRLGRNRVEVSRSPGVNDAARDSEASS
ncbi:MAG: diguanylate cyclase [Acidobacteria bacterium]|nr:diguanylate cyclase [Acidobacteriota bacterium]